MPPTIQLDEVCRQLSERYGEKGQSAGERLRLWMSGAVPFAESECLAQHFREEQLDLLFDAFWRELPFGTGGRRGRVGYGANRFNTSTLATTVQGHCDYLRSVYGEKEGLGVVIANDIREFNDVAGTYRFLPAEHPLIGLSSYKLARFAAQIYAANGLIAYLPPFPSGNSAKVLNTPELAYVIGRMDEVVGGINLSASHNPPDDNGIKVYDSQGSQPVAPDDEQLMQTMIRVREVKYLDFEVARKKGFIREFSPLFHDDYLQIYLDDRGSKEPIDRAIPIVYTPLCGGGENTAGELLTKAGFNVLVPPDQGPDGSFSAIPFRIANPEVFEATGPARAFAESKQAALVLSSDPDADRIGVELRLSDGSWHHCDGNQIAAILAYYLMVDPEGPRRQGLLIETLVTTKILGKIVEAAGNSWLIDDLLVGFKYVADVLKRLGRGEAYGAIQCRPDQLVLAVEESHGVITSAKILDKDSSPACLYIAELHLRLVKQGRNLLDYYVEILERFGDFDNVNRSLMMSGAEGVVRKQRIMEWLRATPPQTIAGSKVNRVCDYWDESVYGPFRGEADRSSRDVVQLQCEGLVVTVRPSGTEAKLKLYVQLLPGLPALTPDEHDLNPAFEGGQRSLRDRFLQLRARAESVACEVYNVLLQPLDCQLAGAGLLVSDVVDLDRKLEFESKTIPALYDYLRSNPSAELGVLLDWLRNQCQAMTPGSDPSMAVKAAIAEVCELWGAKLKSSPALDQLTSWARA